jgi:hypothetical protein
VIGPFGEELTLDRLPPANTVRWTVRRKAEVVAAVRGGLLTFDEACARYALAMEELISWQGALQKSGMRGLRITRSCAESRIPRVFRLESARRTPKAGPLRPAKYPQMDLCRLPSIASWRRGRQSVFDS